MHSMVWWLEAATAALPILVILVAMVIFKRSAATAIKPHREYPSTHREVPTALDGFRISQTSTRGRGH
jgi:hypothetical protein